MLINYRYIPYRSNHPNYRSLVLRQKLSETLKDILTLTFYGDSLKIIFQCDFFETNSLFDKKRFLVRLEKSVLVSELEKELSPSDYFHRNSSTSIAVMVHFMSEVRQVQYKDIMNFGKIFIIWKRPEVNKTKYQRRLSRLKVNAKTFWRIQLKFLYMKALCRQASEYINQ